MPLDGHRGMRAMAWYSRDEVAKLGLDLVARWRLLLGASSCRKRGRVVVGGCPLTSLFNMLPLRTLAQVSGARPAHAGEGRSSKRECGLLWGLAFRAKAAYSP